DIVLQEHYSPQGEARQGEGPQALVPASKGFHRTGQNCAGEAYATYPSSSQMPTKAKGNSKGKKGKQGKSQSKQNDQMSPFQAEPKSFAPWTTLDTSAFTPSTTLSPNPFAAASSSLVAQDQEWVEALKRAYPDPALMPEETKLLVEKAEKTHGRKGIKNLHQATTYLGKVKDHLSEVSDHRRAHRALWMKHMAAGIQIWEQQLDEFRKHQAFLTEQASKARQEITATSRIIQQLSHTAGGTSAPPPLTVVTAEVEEHTEDAADKEEETLRTNLQAVLRNCAGSLGLDIEPPKAVEVVEEVEAPLSRLAVLSRGVISQKDGGQTVPPLDQLHEGSDSSSSSREGADDAIAAREEAARMDQPVDFAPDPRTDAAVGILGQLIVTQRPADNQRSAVLSVYDSDPDAERIPVIHPEANPRHACHIILEQGHQPSRAAIVLSALFEGPTHDAITQGAYSVGQRQCPDQGCSTGSCPRMEYGVTSHVIIVQAPKIEWSTSLVSVSDYRLGPNPMRIAITTLEHVTFEQIVHGVHYDDLCRHRQEPVHCDVWYQQMHLLPGQRMPCWTGYSFVLHVSRHRQPPIGQPEGDHQAMFQTFGRASPASPPRCSDATHAQQIRVDFEPAQKALQWLDTHFTLPTYDIEAQLDPVACWLPQCLDWIRQEWYDWDGPVECIRVYYDGSFEPKTETSGSATAAFVLQDGTWKFAGALSVQQHKPKFESYTAELTASLIACKQVFDLVKINAEIFSTSPAVEFLYDSLSVGKQSEGQWQARQDPITCHAIRLVREWVSGVHVPADLLAVFQALEQEGLDVAEMCERIHMPSLLETLRAPPFLIQLMKDIHASTWMTIGSRRFANTKRGTRPGSPLADCVFHILMADILHQLHEWIHRQEDFQRILAEYDIPGGFVAWADDLAIPWATTRAADMPKELRRILQFVLQLFEKYGFLLNLEKGKTSAVVLRLKPDEVASIPAAEILKRARQPAMGPLPLFKDSRERDLRSALAKLAQCENQLHIEQVPDDSEQHQNLFWQRLTAQTQLWFQRFQDGGFDADTIKELPDAWLDQSADQDPRYGNWLESVYISWGEKVMPDVLAELIDGEAEMLIEQAFTDMIYDFPRMQLLTEITFLRQKIRRLETEQHVLFPHRTVKRGSANAKERAARISMRALKPLLTRWDLRSKFYPLTLQFLSTLVAQGSEFFFQGIFAAAWSLRFGSLYLSEHPWMPEDEQKV
ncbi:unnamed protein product, partial [Cladocopium goreaui]